MLLLALQLKDIVTVFEALDNTGLLALMAGGGLLMAGWLKKKMEAFLDLKHEENRKHFADLSDKIDTLTRNVEEHNKYGERLVVLEAQIGVVTTILGGKHDSPTIVN